MYVKPDIIHTEWKLCVANNVVIIIELDNGLTKRDFNTEEDTIHLLNHFDENPSTNLKKYILEEN